MVGTNTNRGYESMGILFWAFMCIGILRLAIDELKTNILLWTCKVLKILKSLVQKIQFSTCGQCHQNLQKQTFKIPHRRRGMMIQFIKCVLGLHKWIALGSLHGSFTISDMRDSIFVNGCSCCGKVTFLYVRFAPSTGEDKRR